MTEVGSIAPDFALPNQDGKIVRLSDFRGKRVVIFTFPKAGTAGCTAQACNLREAFPKLEAEDTVILGISADSPEDLKKWQAQQRLPYDLLSDPEHKVLEAWGVWGMQVLFVKLPVVNRTSWVIDENGVVVDRKAPINPNENARWALDVLARMPKLEAERA